MRVSYRLVNIKKGKYICGQRDKNDHHVGKTDPVRKYLYYGCNHGNYQVQQQRYVYNSAELLSELDCNRQLNKRTQYRHNIAQKK